MADTIDEKVTIQNGLSVPVTVHLVSRAPDGTETTAEFGPIDAEGEGSGSIVVTPGGAFLVTAKWEYDGKERSSQTFTANLTNNQPITPVTLTLGSPFSSPTMGQWKSVVWAEAE